MDFTKNLEGVVEANEFEKEIASAIRKNIPSWKESTDENIRDYCGLFTVVEMLVGNKGFTIEQAIDYILK